jgi:hypothetical protein
MAKPQEANAFLKRATKMGLEQMLNDANELLKMDLTEAQRITNEEMKLQLEQHLKEVIA